jgi:pimeloyl-ACP methyl ester carboxylesterase
MEFISTRVDDRGGPVSNAVAPSGFSLRAPRAILLIHGFNVDRPSGEKGYGAFAALLQNNGVSNISVLGQLVGFLWPGDKNIRVIGALFYPAEMTSARESASLLADFLVKLRGPGGGPIQVVLVAHSLGNRVALELINDILSRPNQTWGRVEGICLMAAAVPVRMVDYDGRLAAAARAVRSRNLFSRTDKVLRWAFPSGEMFAGEGFFPQAVGLFGNPVALWNEGFDLQPYDHGHYFYGKDGNDSSARFVSQFLGAAVPRQPFAAQPSVNTLPPPNTIPPRRIGS